MRYKPGIWNKIQKFSINRISVLLDFPITEYHYNDYWNAACLYSDQANLLEVRGGVGKNSDTMFYLNMKRLNWHVAYTSACSSLFGIKFKEMTVKQIQFKKLILNFCSSLLFLPECS